MSDSLIKILYVDDELHNLSVFKATFRMEFEVHAVSNVADARKILQEKEINIIITDQRMPDMTGVEFLCSILDEYPEPMRILLTGYSDIEAVINAINLGQIYQYVSKPWDEKHIRVLIQKAYEVYSLRKENKELMKQLLAANKQLEFMLRQKLIS